MTTPDWEQLSLQEDEILEIRSLYPGQVKVLCHDRRFQNVVILSMSGLDITLKFILTDMYPKVAPRISIGSSTLSPDQQAALTTHLQEIAELKKGQQMMQHLADTALKWMEGNGFIPAAKTAADIINMIMGNSDLILEDFCIGFIDDFGVFVEKCFTALTSKDTASVDMFTQAVPHHCIEYIKYKTDVVWDKNKRIDNLFGITKSNLNFTTAIKHYEKKENEEKEEKNGAMEQPVGAVGGKNREEVKVKLQVGDTDDSLTKMEEVISKNPMNFEDEMKIKGEEHKRIKPNFFLSFDISDENIKRNATEMQEILVSYLPHYEDYVIPEDFFHITLAVMNLRDTEQISYCSKLLKDLKPKLAQMARKVPPVALGGLGTFWDGLIFGKVALSSELLDFVNFMSESLLEGGVNIIKDKDKYTPHLTLIKYPGSDQGVATHWKIQHCCWQFRNRNFGTQKLDAIHLCEINLVDGKYPSVIRIKLQ